MSADRVVTEAVLERAEREVQSGGWRESMRHLKQVEPALYDRVVRGIGDACGPLEPYMLAEDVNRTVADELWTTALVVVRALQLGQYELWRGTVQGTLLEQIDPALASGRRGGEDTGSRGEDGSS